jgi:cytosine/adenosine deaminase-related metal-dependent hydrolase
MFEEARSAFFKGRDTRAGLGADKWLSVLASNQRLASEAFGIDLRELQVGAAADLVVLDYLSPTELTVDNLAWHLVFGLNSASVESVMVNGSFVVRNRKPRIDEGYVYERARAATEKLWGRLRGT